MESSFRTFILILDEPEQTVDVLPYRKAIATNSLHKSQIIPIWDSHGCTANSERHSQYRVHSGCRKNYNRHTIKFWT